MIQATEETLGFLKEIETKYLEAKNKKLSRNDVAWGKWSHEFNAELRKRCKDHHSQADQYHFLFVFWSVVSNLLELHHRNKFGKKGPKRKLIREARAAKKIITTGKLP